MPAASSTGLPPSISAASAALRSGQLSPGDLVTNCLDRIGRHDARLRAWVLVDAEGAHADARRLADELARGHDRGPLHGIPVGIKDIIDVFDWPTAAGSRLWAASLARHDATVVRRLRQAGAVLLGKTVTTPYASFDPPPTRNPHDLVRTPGGSSSGSAAAVAAGMCLAALGSQTGGSITRPASYCGVAGCKPTFGRVSLHGVVPLAPSLDHLGPLARTVADLALVLQAIAGPDPLDPACSRRPVPDYAARLREPGPPPRLGWLGGLFHDRAEPPVRAMMGAAVAAIREAGGRVTPVPLPPAFREVIPRHRQVMAVEAAAYHRDRLRRHPDDYGPSIRALLEEGLACPAPEYARTRQHRRELRRALRSCFEGLDALLCPATTGPAPDAATTGDPAFNSPWSYAGLPTVSLPVATTPDGLPLAIQLVGRAWDEAGLFAAAAWCEFLFRDRVPAPPLS